MTAISTKAKAPVIEGKLTPAVVGNILKKLEQNRSAAYLLVSDGLAEKCIYFSVGAVRLSSIGRRQGMVLGDLLEGSLPPEVFARARQKAADSGMALEDVLADPLLGRGDIVRECSAMIVRDELLDLIPWDGAFYEYCESNPPPKIFDPRLEAVKLSFGAAKVLKEVEEAAARYPAIAQRLGPARSRLQPGGTHAYGPPSGVDPRVGALLLEIVAEAGGKGITIEETIREGRRRGVDCIVSSSALALMVEGRTLEVSRRERLSPEEERAQVQKELDELEAKLDLLINELIARQRLAQDYIAVGDERRAAFNLKKVGEELMGRNRVDEAIDAFKRVLKITPNDFAVRERMIRLFERLKKMPEAIGEGIALANIYKRFGLANRTKNLYRYLIGLDPFRIDVRRWLIDLLIRLKDPKAAIAEYEQLADLLKQQGMEDELLAVYQQILALDPNHKLASMQVGTMARRRLSFLLPYAGVAAGLLIVAVVALYFSYEYRALKAYAESKGEALSLADKDRVPEAKRVLDGFAERWEWSRVVDRARELAVRLGGLEDERRERRARELYDRGFAAENAGDIPGARAIYLQVTGSTKWGEEAGKRLEALRIKEEDAKKRAVIVRQAVYDGRDADAFRLARELLGLYPWSEAAQLIEVPFKVESTPAGAQVTVDGTEPHGRTPTVILRRAYRNGLPAPFRVDLVPRDPSYETAVRRIDLLAEDTPYPLHVALRRRLFWPEKLATRAPLTAAPAVLPDGTVLLAGRDERLYAIRRDGHLAWERPLGLGADGTATPCAVAGRAVASDATGYVTAFDLATGERLWRRKLGSGPAVAVAPGEKLPIVAVDGAGRIYGIDPLDAGDAWPPIDGPAKVSHAPVVDPETGIVFVVFDDGNVLGVDAAKGDVRARFAVGGRPGTAPAIYRSGAIGIFLVATDDGVLRAYGVPDGTPRWRFSVGEGVGAGPVVAPPGVGSDLVLAGTTGGLHALKPTDGSVFWSTEVRGGIVARPAARGSAVYVGTTEGLVSYPVEGGKERWIFRTPREVVAAPVPCSSGVLLAASDGFLYAVED